MDVISCYAVLYPAVRQ